MAKLCDHGYFLEVAPRSCPKCRTDIDLIQREEIATLKVTISRLRDENQAAWDSAEYNARRARKAEAAIEKLREYTRHKPWCLVRVFAPCDCGYDELMEELEDGK